MGGGPATATAKDPPGPTPWPADPPASWLTGIEDVTDSGALCVCSWWKDPLRDEGWTAAWGPWLDDPWWLTSGTGDGAVAFGGVPAGVAVAVDVPDKMGAMRGSTRGDGRSAEAAGEGAVAAGAEGGLLATKGVDLWTMPRPRPAVGAADGVGQPVWTSAKGSPAGVWDGGTVDVLMRMLPARLGERAMPPMDERWGGVTEAPAAVGEASWWARPAAQVEPFAWEVERLGAGGSVSVPASPPAAAASERSRIAVVPTCDPSNVTMVATDGRDVDWDAD